MSIAMSTIGATSPTGTTQPIITKLEGELQRVVALPEIAERMKSIPVRPATRGSDEFAKVFAADLARWSAVAKAANIKPSD